MTQRELEEYIDNLWGKHSTYERSGVLMREIAFHAAVREILQHMGINVTSIQKPEVEW
jgi:hypothetical protein